MNTTLWPANVERLRSLGVTFNHRPAEHDIKLDCPVCGGVLLIHEEKPWHLCAGITCSSFMLNFEEVLGRMPRHGLETARTVIERLKQKHVVGGTP